MMRNVASVAVLVSEYVTADKAGGSQSIGRLLQHYHTGGLVTGCREQRMNIER
jgi:hypothetical protein